MSSRITLWCGLPPMQMLVLIVFGLALLSVSMFTVTLENGNELAISNNAAANSLRAADNRWESLSRIGVNASNNVDNTFQNRLREKVELQVEKSGSINAISDAGKLAGKGGNLNVEKAVSRTSIPTRTSVEAGTATRQTLDAFHANTKDRSLSDKRAREQRHFHSQKTDGGVDLHFIHIPKCGGTSMTAILRQITCDLDPVRNADCCTNEGFCDFHAHRRCASIRGCINHIPQRPWIYKAPPSVMLLREPSSRLLSAWFYRCHSPNIDCYQVRPEFKLIHDGKRPKATFEEYLDMPEYSNIQTRMLGADSFPYRNVSITMPIFEAAVDAIDNAFFVGLQEAYDLSVKLLLRELGVHKEIAILKERDNTASKSIKAEKAAIQGNAKLMSKIKAVNEWDVHLYRVAKERFCATISAYPDLVVQLRETTKVRCDS